MSPLTAGDRALLRQVFAHARKKGWSRSRILADRDIAAWEDDCGSTISLERWSGDGLVLDANGVIRCDVVTLEFAVDILATGGVLPVEFHSARKGMEVQWGVGHAGCMTTKQGWTEEQAHDWAAPVDGYEQLQVNRRLVGPWEQVTR